MIEREDNDTRLLTYATVVCLTGRSRENTAQCEYIESSIEQSWFDGVVLWSRICGTISVQLVMDPCKGYVRVFYWVAYNGMSCTECDGWGRVERVG